VVGSTRQHGERLACASIVENLEKKAIRNEQERTGGENNEQRRKFTKDVHFFLKLEIPPTMQPLTLFAVDMRAS